MPSGVPFSRWSNIYHRQSFISVDELKRAIVEGWQKLPQSTFVTYYGYCHSLDGATLFSKVDSNKLRFNVKNEMTLICAKFDADLSIFLKLQAVKQCGPAFLAYPVQYRGN